MREQEESTMGSNAVVLSEAKELAIQDLIREIEKHQSIIQQELDDNWEVSPEEYEELAVNLLRIYKIYYGHLSRNTLDRQTCYLWSYLDYALRYEGEYLSSALQPAFIDRYLGCWYITHNFCIKDSSIRDNCTALTKLAKMMHEYDLLEQQQLTDILGIMKEKKSVWLENRRRYDTEPVSLDPEEALEDFLDIFFGKKD